MSKSICLDAGHYGKYNRSPAVRTYYESVMNWKLHNYLAKELEAYGFKVVKTRKKQDEDLGNTLRGKKAKGCDLFISIHSNAVDNKVHEDIDYPVVYVPINGSADRIGVKLAKIVGTIMGTKQPGRIAERKGNNGDYYGVIRGAVSVGVPGIIIEHSFHTNTRSTKWLSVDSNLMAMAKAEADAIAEHFGVEKPSVFYRVQVGAYSVLANARRTAQQLKDDGFDTYLVVDPDSGYIKVQTGAYANKENATKMAGKLRNKGYSTYITTKGGEPVKGW